MWTLIAILAAPFHRTCHDHIMFLNLFVETTPIFICYSFRTLLFPCSVNYSRPTLTWLSEYNGELTAFLKNFAPCPLRRGRSFASDKYCSLKFRFHFIFITSGWELRVLSLPSPKELSNLIFFLLTKGVHGRKFTVTWQLRGWIVDMVHRFINSDY